MGLQGLDDAVKDQNDTHCGNEDADDASNGINPHCTQFFGKLPAQAGRKYVTNIVARIVATMRRSSRW
jgi:hypothetical protein